MSLSRSHRDGRKSSWYANTLNNLLRLLWLAFVALMAVVIYRYLLGDIVSGRSHFYAYIAIWLFTAYFLLPRLYRVVSRLYLPDYFFGRTQTGDGLLGDPINIACNGTREELIAAMTAAGWMQAEPLSLASSLKMVYATLTGTSYPTAPVSSLYVFGRKQSLAFEQEVSGGPRKRRHIRFWHTPERWWLPGGYHADWLGAATYDKNIGLSLFTWQFTHKIDANVDSERDFVVKSLKEAKAVKDLAIVPHFTTSYHSRNGGGDVIHTDGSLPFVTVGDPKNLRSIRPAKR